MDARRAGQEEGPPLLIHVHMEPTGYGDSRENMGDGGD